jgi:plasmid maintenance system antidote protein VapI
MIHIGSNIRDYVDKQGISITWFAERLDCTRTTIYNIFTRKTIDSGLLLKISEVLNHDFFEDYENEYYSKKRSKSTKVK